MPLPEGEGVARAAFLRWTLGDASAADFLAEVSAIARAADDIADGAADPQLKAMDLLRRCLVVLPQNVFFKAHSALLAATLNEAIISWRLGDEWRRSEDPKRQAFGYVYRESTDRIAHAVAFLLGGQDHALNVARELYDLCHAPFPETLQQWKSEG